MTIEAARWIVGLGLGYTAIGLVFAIAFVLFGAGRIDPDAERGSWGFRLLVLPGSAALWPVLLKRWLKGTPPPVERAPHRGSGEHAPLRRRHRLWTQLLALGLPVGVVLGLSARQPLPTVLSTPNTPSSAPVAEFDFANVEVHGHIFVQDGIVRVELRPEDLQQPDVLVYWSEAAPVDGSLPTLTATLIGKLAGDDARMFNVPAAGGWLHLYSLGHQTLLDSSPLPSEVR